MHAQVSIENNLGGFEMFSSGKRELAPELLGWYGSPGYNTKQGRQLFLSGDNFSVHGSRLIIGNREVPYRLLSKQIMEVTLPAGLPFVDDPNLLKGAEDDYEGVLDAQLATPYGVSGHLLIPVVRMKVEQGVQVPTLQSQTVVIEYETKTDGMPEVTSVDAFLASVPSGWLNIHVPESIGVVMPTAEIQLQLRAGADRLQDAEIASVAVSRDGDSYSVSTSVLDASITETAAKNLKASVEHYLNYLLKHDLPATEVRLTATAFIGPSTDSANLPCAGEVTLLLRQAKQAAD